MAKISEATITSIKLTISEDEAQQSISISILNLLGQKVYQFSDKNYQPGEYIFNWNGLDQLGNRVGNGTYFWVIQTNNLYEVKRVMLIK